MKKVIITIVIIALLISTNICTYMYTFKIYAPTSVMSDRAVYYISMQEGKLVVNHSNLIGTSTIKSYTLDDKKNVISVDVTIICLNEAFAKDTFKDIKQDNEQCLLKGNVITYKEDIDLKTYSEVIQSVERLETEDGKVIVENLINKED